MVGARWKALPDDERKYYQDLAKEDSIRQKEAMKEYYRMEQRQQDDPTGSSKRESEIDQSSPVVEKLELEPIAKIEDEVMDVDNKKDATNRDTTVEDSKAVVTKEKQWRKLSSNQMMLSSLTKSEPAAEKANENTMCTSAQRFLIMFLTRHRKMFNDEAYIIIEVLSQV